MATPPSHNKMQAPSLATNKGGGSGLLSQPTAPASPSTPASPVAQAQARDSASKRIKETLAVDSNTVVVPKIGAEEITTFYPPIGEGAFSKVYKGRCRGKDVAIKVLDNIEFDASILEEFIDEVEIMAHLLHPNIVLLMGACVESHYGENNWAIITEYMPRGDLYGILHDPSLSLTMSQKLQFAIDVGQGMAWLQGRTPMILHRDLKPTNVLVDENWTCKICDFGLSQIKRSKRKVIDDEDAPGSVLWMAPEVLLNKSIDEKIDIYSFGLVLWEIVTQGDLFTTYDDKAVFTEDIAIKGVRPPIEKVPDVMLPIITKCWDEKPAVRPSFEKLIPLLQQARIDYHLPRSLCADAGRLWAKYWKDKWRVPFDKFVSHLFRYLKVPPNTLHSECLRALVAAEQHAENLVTIDRFSSLLKWFGPLRRAESEGPAVTLLDRVEALLRKPWFFGDITLTDAEAKLEPHKSRPGTFLVRLNLGAQGTLLRYKSMEKTPFTISRIAQDGEMYHTRVYPSKKGQAGYWLKIRDGDREITAKQAGELQDLIAKVTVDHPSILKSPCSGHPYADLFSQVQKKGPYEAADLDSEESGSADEPDSD